MKKSYALFVAILITLTSSAQLKIESGGVLTIGTGSFVTVEGDVTSFANIQGAGTVELKGSAVQNINMNGFTIPNLQVNNSANINLNGSAVVSNSFGFLAGKVLLNSYDLTLGTGITPSTFTGFDDSKFFVTNGAGRLVKTGVSASGFTYPVGADATTYNPLRLVETGTADNFGVRCLSNVLANGTAGSQFVREVVDASWEVSDANTANSSNLSVTAFWNGVDELNGFNRTKTGISKYDGTSGTWDMTNAMTGVAVSGTGPYSVTRSSTSAGLFAIGNKPVLTPLVVAPKVFLQGAYASNDLMNDRLRTAGVLPTTEPYTGMTGFTHLGSGGGEKIPSSLLSGISTSESIVDWVFVQLHRGSDSAVIATTAALLKRNGQLASIDGTDALVNYINFAGEAAGDYFITVRHRNHLSVRSASKMTLGKNTSSYDFTGSLGSAYRKSTISTNDPMAVSTDGRFMMWAGNANNDAYVRSLSSTVPFILSDASFITGNLLGGNSFGTITGYSSGDVNMDGKVRAITQLTPLILSDVSFITGNVLGGVSNATRQEHK